MAPHLDPAQASDLGTGQDLNPEAVRVARLAGRHIPNLLNLPNLLNHSNPTAIIMVTILIVRIRRLTISDPILIRGIGQVRELITVIMVVSKAKPLR